jgi:ABC-2 type transport system permease protein
MSANSAFQIVNEQGWRRGFANMLRKENRDWWGTRRWWVNVLIWLALVNGVLALSLWVDPAGAPVFSLEQRYQNTLGGLLSVLGIFGAIGAVVSVQGAIIDEKKSGTAAWIASKPVSRPAFILSKLLANTFALFIVVFVVQGAVAYLQFAILGKTPPLGAYAVGVLLVALHMLFYLTLTLMLGTIFTERGAVIAIPIGIILSAQFLMGLLGSLVQFTPWPLIFPSELGLSLSLQPIMDIPLTNVMPILATIVLIAVFVAVAIWRYQRDEF